MRQKKVISQFSVLFEAFCRDGRSSGARDKLMYFAQHLHSGQPVVPKHEDRGHRSPADAKSHARLSTTPMKKSSSQGFAKGYRRRMDGKTML